MPLEQYNKISIVIPVYNKEKYLARCIDLPVNQTYTNIEILLIDDGSQDNSSDIIKEHTKRYPRICSSTHKNQSADTARNIGLKNACD